MKKIIFFLVLLGLLFGTNNYQELNNIAIITNIGMMKKEDNYKIIYQEVIPMKSDNRLTNKYKYHEVKGTTLNDCFKKIEENISKEIYLDHLENIVINTDEKKIINKLNHYFKDDLDNFNIILTPNDIEKVIKYNNNYHYINSLISKKTSYRKIKKANLEHKEIQIPVIKITNNRLSFYKYDKLGDKK